MGWMRWDGMDERGLDGLRWNGWDALDKWMGWIKSSAPPGPILSFSGPFQQV